MQQGWEWLSSPWVLVLLALFVGMVALRAHAGGSEQRGPFQVHTHTSSYLKGWNEGRLERRSSDHYSVRCRGRLVSFDGPLNDYSDQTRRYGKRLNAVLSFAARPEVLVVNVGDGNNGSYYYLLQVVDAQVQAKWLGKDRRGVAWAMLDQPRPSGKRSYQPRRQHHERGSLLQLEDRTLLDLQDLSLYQADAIFDPGINHFAEPLGASPDRRSGLYISFAEDGHYQLLLVDYHSNQLQRVAIDRQRMRFFDWTVIDLAWVEHHYRWKPDQAGHLRLVERPEFHPLPHQGRQSTHTMGYLEYEIQPVKPQMLAAMLTLLDEHYPVEQLPFDEREQARALSGPDAACEREIRIGEQIIELRFSGFSVATLTLRARQPSAHRLLMEIATMIDAELTNGNLDPYFSAADLPWTEG